MVFLMISYGYVIILRWKTNILILMNKVPLICKHFIFVLILLFLLKFVYFVIICFSVVWAYIQYLFVSKAGY